MCTASWGFAKNDPPTANYVSHLEVEVTVVDKFINNHMHTTVLWHYVIYSVSAGGLNALNGEDSVLSTVQTLLFETTLFVFSILLIKRRHTDYWRPSEGLTLQVTN